MKNLLIYGASGLGKEIFSLAREYNNICPRWNIVGFIDDKEGLVWDFCGLPIVGSGCFFDSISAPTDVVIAIADPFIKEKLSDRLSKNELISFPTIIHPSAIVDESAIIGEGTIITAMCFVSVDVVLGKFVFMNVAARVGHDTVIGDFCSLMPNVDVGGNVKIGQKTFAGVSSSIHQGISIGDESFIGMGSVVIQDIKDNGKVFGNPAMPSP